MKTTVNICQHLMHDERGDYKGILRFVPVENALQIAKERDDALAAARQACDERYEIEQQATYERGQRRNA